MSCRSQNENGHERAEPRRRPRRRPGFEPDLEQRRLAGAGLAGDERAAGGPGGLAQERVADQRLGQALVLDVEALTLRALPPSFVVDARRLGPVRVLRDARANTAERARVVEARPAVAERAHGR
jgi:hypothetical protein